MKDTPLVRRQEMTPPLFTISSAHPSISTETDLRAWGKGLKTEITHQRNRVSSHSNVCNSFLCQAWTLIDPGSILCHNSHEHLLFSQN